MSEDHTTGLGGTNTPRSQVAQNDAAVGQLIAALSRSPYWSSTAVFVTEDDSQDGIDHVDGHRNVLLVASPYAKQRSADGCLGGYIGHAHYDQASVLRTAELMLGVPPISAYDAGATPLYGLFQAKDSASQLTAADLAPFVMPKNPSFIDETVASLPKSSKTASLRAYSKTLDLTHLDRDQASIEAVLWESLRDDPLPHELAAKLAGSDERPVTAPVTTVSSAQEVSTAGGRPLRTGATVACGKAVPVTLPVRPGQTSLGAGGLPATGLAWRVAAVGLALLAGAGAVRRARRS